MVDKTRGSSASRGLSNARSHSTYCEATGPVVDEGFVAARIRELQKAYHQTSLPTQSHSPMSPCPIYPKLQKYEFFSHAEPHELPMGSSVSRVYKQIGNGTPRSPRSNQVTPKHLRSSDGVGTCHGSADNIGPTKFLLPHYRNLISKGHDDSCGGLNDGLTGQALEHVSSPKVVLPSTLLLKANDHKERASQTDRSPLLNSSKVPEKYQTPKSGVSRELADATRPAEKHRNEPKVGPRHYNLALISQPTKRYQTSHARRNQPLDTTPSPSNGLSSSPAGGMIQSESSDRPSSFHAHNRPNSYQIECKEDQPGIPDPPASPLTYQDLRPQIYSISSRKIQRAWSLPQTSLSKIGYEDGIKAYAHFADVNSYGPSPGGRINPDLSNTLSLVGQDESGEPNDSNRRPSSASTNALSFVSGTPSRQLWKNWRPWKLVLVDKKPSSQDLSDKRKSSSPSFADEITNQPAEAPQRMLDIDSASPRMQQARNMGSSHSSGEVEEREPRTSVEAVPGAEVEQSLRNAIEVLETDASAGKILASTAVEITAAPSAGGQPSEWVATFPLDEPVGDSNTTSLMKVRSDDLSEPMDSKDASRGQTIKKIQVVISFDGMTDLVIEALLKGRKTAE
jgi:hypothetical protein